MNFFKLALITVMLSPLLGHGADLDPMCRDQLPFGCWVTEDVIDNRIEHFAQTALMGMLQRGGEEAADASAILCAVKRGQIEGIYLPDRQVPAMRARAAGSNYWEMIPKGQLSVCYTAQPKQGAKRAPLITFRNQIRNDSRQVANAVSNAWQACGIEPTAPRCYRVTITKPGCDSLKWSEIYYKCMGCEVDAQRSSDGSGSVVTKNCPMSDEQKKCEENIDKLYKDCMARECPGSLGTDQVPCYRSVRARTKCSQEVATLNRGYYNAGCFNKHGDMARHQQCLDKANAMASCNRQSLKE
jgi:hypothetical protein